MGGEGKRTGYDTTSKKRKKGLQAKTGDWIETSFNFEITRALVGQRELSPAKKKERPEGNPRLLPVAKEGGTNKTRKQLGSATLFSLF